MKVIVGLGNPGLKYNNTRHNIGFMVLDALAERLEIDVNKGKFDSLVGEGFLNGEKVILVKPLTYMNLSGQAIGPLVSFYKLGLEDILVVYDDMSLDLGKIRLRPKGSAGGHNGIKSLIQHLGSQDFSRLKVGIGRPPVGDVTSYVLGSFSKEETETIKDSITEALGAIEAFSLEGINQAMNKFN